MIHFHIQSTEVKFTKKEIEQVYQKKEKEIEQSQLKHVTYDIYIYMVWISSHPIN